VHSTKVPSHHARMPRQARHLYIMSTDAVDQASSFVPKHRSRDTMLLFIIFGEHGYEIFFRC